MSQLALPLQLSDHAVFSSFHAVGNELLMASLHDLAAGRSHDGCWLWGAPASGRTHLLQAVCEAAEDGAIYLPMSILKDAGPQMLEGLANLKIICIDDVEAICGQPDFEAALFDLCNQALDCGAQLVVAADSAPRDTAIVLPDLASRLQRLPVFRVQSLNEEQSVVALRLRSRHRGLDLPIETAQYLLRRSRRDMASLYSLLDRLDAAALRAKRRLTVPFVRGVLNGDD